MENLICKIRKIGGNMDGKELNLPDYLGEEQKNRILKAIKNNTPIIITGRQGKTGKTYLRDYLSNFGIVAYELWECEVIELNDFI